MPTQPHGSWCAAARSKDAERLMVRSVDLNSERVGLAVMYREPRSISITLVPSITNTRHLQPLRRPPLSNPPSTIGSLRTPDGSQFIALLQAFRSSGGTATETVVGGLLAEHHQPGDESLNTRIRRGHVFGFPWRSDLWIPMFQFDSDLLSIKPAAQKVRALLPASWSGWTTASWFAHPQDALCGSRPVDLVHDDLDAVIAAAAAA